MLLPALTSLFLLGAPALGNEEDLAPYESISAMVALPKPYGNTAVSLSRKDKGRRLGDIIVRSGLKVITISHKKLKAFKDPQLNTLQVTHGPDTDGTLCVFVKFAYGPPGASGAYAKASIMIKDGKARTIYITEADGGFKSQGL